MYDYISWGNVQVFADNFKQKKRELIFAAPSLSYYAFVFNTDKQVYIIIAISARAAFFVTSFTLSLIKPYFP